MKRILLLLLVGCGAKAAPVRVPDILDPPEVLDVATLAPLPVGFRFTTTLHRDATSKDGAIDQDGAWTVEVLDITDGAPSGLRVAFDHLTTKQGDRSLPFALSGETVQLSTTAQTSQLTHDDGSPASAEEQQAFLAFYGQGGTYLPGRDVLIGKRLERGVAIDVPEAIPGVALMNPPSAPTEAKLTLDNIDDHGQATITLDAGGAISAALSWKIHATLITDAKSLQPSSLDVVYDDTNPVHSELKQQFTYPAS